MKAAQKEKMASEEAKHPEPGTITAVAKRQVFRADRRRTSDCFGITDSGEKENGCRSVFKRISDQSGRNLRIGRSWKEELKKSIKILFKNYKIKYF